MASHTLPSASPKVLDSIPLVGLPGHGRPEKFFLGQLGTLRDRSVQEVIDASVASYLEHKTFNDTHDIAALIKDFGGDVSIVAKHFSSLV